MKRKAIIKALLLIFLCVCGVLAVYLTYPFFAYGKYSKKQTTVDVPKNLCLDFYKFDKTIYTKYDELETMHTDIKGQKHNAVRSYFQNNTTGERLVEITDKNDGGFLKGYYLSDYSSCVYYSDGTVKLFGSQTGKIYCFYGGSLEYVSEVKTCRRLFGDVYVTTFFDRFGERIAVKTEPAYFLGNIKMQKAIYSGFFGKNLLPITKKNFESRTSKQS